MLDPSFVLGAHGAIAAILRAAPGLRVQLWGAVQVGDHKQARGLHEKLLRLWSAISHDNLPANVKYCLERQGRRAGMPRPPMPGTSARQAGPIRQALSQAGLVQP